MLFRLNFELVYIWGTKIVNFRNPQQLQRIISTKCSAVQRLCLIKMER